jgi:hypothetical protein
MPSEDTWTLRKTNTVSALESRIREWQNTPHFGALPKDQKPVNTYWDVKRWSEVSRTRQVFIPPGGTPIVNFDGYELSPSDMENILVSEIESKLNATFWRNDSLNSVQIKALGKIADAKVNVAVALAEAHKTSDLIYSTARRIDKAYRALRKGDFRTVARELNITPKKVHNTWLEYKYGWMPLLMDVKGAAEFFAQQHVVRPPRFTVVSTDKFRKEYTFKYVDVTYGDPTVKEPVQQKGFMDYSCKVKIWCELSYPHLSELQQLGLTNPALVAWELVPYSFVLDWFISVGDWLTGITALNGVTVRRAMVSDLDTRGWSLTEGATQVVKSGITYNMSARNWGHLRRHYQRVRLELSPLSLHPPLMKSFNFPKLVTSLALLRGAHRGTPRL